ncbi:HAMP domain-containing histidine kinase [Ruminococcaceae bacterium OttesenSCG-928-O06]|nr:HAMP domain-containing histidine kinase [Ruminococcaceae bacterium OttesenSCG-928-O06]
MNSGFFQPFEDVAYPCFLLEEDRLYMNDAAKNTGEPLCDEQFMKRYLSSAMQQGTEDMQGRPHTLPLVSRTACTYSLTLVPTAHGLLAVALQESPPPVNAFSMHVRELLTNIFAALPLLSSRLEDMDTRYVEQVQLNAYHILRLANNMENVTAAEKSAFLPQVVDLSQLLSSLCYCADAVCREHGVPICCTVPDSPVPVYADEKLLSAAFLNLLCNSLQYTRDGNRITVQLRIVKERAVVTVQDEGLGIKPEHLGRIFEPYFSVDPYGDTHMQPGMGLGLSVARETVRSLGGTISAESKFGEGTSFYIGLPLATGQATLLSSGSADYLMNRYSPVYVQLCGYCRLPGL